MMKNRSFSLIDICAAVLMFSTLAAAQQQRCTEDGAIKSVTKMRSGNFELVVFDVLSDTPDYEVKNVRPPFTDYSGENKIYIKGRSFKSVYFKGINWTCKIDERLRAQTSNIMAIKNTENFEGYVEYVIGYRTKAKYVGVSTTKTARGRKITLKFKR